MSAHGSGFLAVHKPQQSSPSRSQKPQVAQRVELRIQALKSCRNAADVRYKHAGLVLQRGLQALQVAWASREPLDRRHHRLHCSCAARAWLARCQLCCDRKGTAGFVVCCAAAVIDACAATPCCSQQRLLSPCSPQQSEARTVGRLAGCITGACAQPSRAARHRVLQP